MKNLEIKVRCNDHRSAIASAKKIKAKYKGILNQKDVYFDVKSGRLKMRIINNKTYELIHYYRDDIKLARYSNYELIKLSSGKHLLALLKNSLGTKCEVVKRRKLFIYENVRIHLDTVKKLGKFIEFEVVCKTKADEKEAAAKMKFLKQIFHFDDRDILPYSYSDMIVLNVR